MSINRSVLFSAFVIAIMTFQGCETDIDIIAPKRDVTVIYGLLEADRERHFIKINRAFVGEDSATVLAAKEGVNEYASNEMSAKVLEINSIGEVLNAWDLIETYGTGKEDGAFFSDSNKIYYFDAQLNANMLYRLECTVNIDGEDEKKVTATTDVIGQAADGGGINQVVLNKPKKSGSSSTNGGSDRNKQEVSLVSSNDYASGFEVEWSEVSGGVLYTSYLRLFYREFNTTTGGVTVDSVTLAIGSKNFEKSGSVIQFPGIGTEDYFATIGRRVEDLDTTVIRNIKRVVSDTIQFYLEVANKELSTYIEVNQPISGVVQDRPEYTNVSNGIGIFGSRVVASTRTASVLTDGRILDNRTMEELLYSNLPQSGGYTAPKSFTRPGRCTVNPATGPNCQ
ncbi:hypothetical protein N8Z47_00170 [Salibacteraceae bacterium]|nr:hypothetical protein [Salibacteraceae bacterium]